MVMGPYRSRSVLRVLGFLLLACLFWGLAIPCPLFASSRSIQVTVKTPQGDTIELYQESYALVVGNGTYEKGWDPLPGAIRDAQEVAEVLRSSGFEVSLKMDLTRQAFNRALTEFVRRHGKDEDNRLLFYYAGHGYTEKMATGEELGYLVMVDAPVPERDPVGFSLASVDMQTLVTQAKMIRSKHALFMFDSCFSGTVLNVRDRVTPSVISDKVRYPVRQFITAGRANEPVPDRSVFKETFLAILQGRDQEPIPDGYLTGEELGLYLKNKVPEYNPTQHPQYGKIRDPRLDKGDFVFILAKAGRAPDEGLDRPPSAVTAMGIISVFGSPEGARVYLDDYYSGELPCTIESVEQGKHTVRVEKTGYKDWTEKVRVVAGDTLKLQTNLEKDLVQVAALEPGAERFTNSIRMEFILIPAGKFDMGSPRREWHRNRDERRHKVTISKPFYMQTTEVTQAQWKAVMEDNPAYFDNCEDCPVERVSWDDCQEFILRLNQMERTIKYRLPTEAEWEYACRAGSVTGFCFGDDDSKLAEYAWSLNNSEGKSHPVARKKPNAWGLHDMHGNVWEWCQDWYGKYRSSRAPDPQGPSRGSNRVYRGGGWNYPTWSCRAANRGSVPVYMNYSLGFRIVRTP